MIQQQSAPASPTTPAPTIITTPVAAARSAPSASAIYEGFRAQRRELTNQLDELESTRREITGQLEDIPAGSPDRTPLVARMADIDSRITSVDHLLASNATDIAKAAAIPGAVVEPPRVVENGPPEEAWVLGGMFMVIVLLPLSIAWARRIWRRSAAAVASFPREIGDRLLRMEQALEATSVEVERIGEGQRFLTRLFTEGEGNRSIGAGAAQPIERKSVKAPERLP
ncbi:MAG TPA: hypothetical protein VNG73_10055 [Gemmatimonadaceae bacterium]|nr:hypothetical protein [Gemmatimonadaceae bacterium]